MPRIRSIKPDFFTNDELAEVKPLGRLLFIGLWCIADKEGRLRDRPTRIKAQVQPFDGANVNKLLDGLQNKGFIKRYEVDGKRYIQIVNFAKHQRPHHKEEASKIPPCLNHERPMVEPSKGDGRGQP